MRYNVPSGITPLQARLATHYYAYLLIPAFIILVFFVIYLLYQMRKRIRSSPEWLEAQKKRPTTYGDIEKTAKRLSLSKAEASLLWEICRAAKAPNISYLIYNAAEVDKLFGAQYAAMLQSGTAEKKITSLFRLRRKIEIQDAADTWITSTAGIPEQTKLFFLSPQGVQIRCALKKNTAENMTLSIPQTLYNAENKPAPLSKADFVFTTKSGMTYRFQTRVIRYSIGFDDGTEMILSHTNDLNQQTKRKSKRSDINIPCIFSAANDKYEKTKPHDGVLANISGDGCAILTNLPIKENQRLCVSIMLPDATYEAEGLIVAVHKNASNNTFSLGILFTDISDKARNRIFAYVYRYGAAAQNGERNTPT